MIIELTAVERNTQELALPAIFANGFNASRIDWYTRLVIESGLVKGHSVIPEFIAAMICESSLQNKTLGDSVPGGHFGVGWCQLDTQYHVHSLDNLLQLRNDPLMSLVYVTMPSNGLVYQGTTQTWFLKQRWAAWTAEKVDPITGWNPLKAAQDAYARVWP